MNELISEVADDSRLPIAKDQMDLKDIRNEQAKQNQEGQDEMNDVHNQWDSANEDFKKDRDDKKDHWGKADQDDDWCNNDTDEVLIDSPHNHNEETQGDEDEEDPLDACPPNFELAKKHRDANRVKNFGMRNVGNKDINDERMF